MILFLLVSDYVIVLPLALLYTSYIFTYYSECNVCDSSGKGCRVLIFFFPGEIDFSPGGAWKRALGEED